MSVPGSGDAALAKIPVVVGVTGHRDVVDSHDGTLAKRIQELLADLAARCPHSDLVLLSALAEGADRLAARAALELPRVSLVVPLPMRRADYEREFSSPESIAEFNALLSRAESWFELPIAEEKLTSSAPGEESQREPYGELGWYIARHSHLLLALWDGNDANGTSGTAKVVSLNLRGLPRPDDLKCDLKEPAGIGPVCHILCPRRDKALAGTSYSLRILYPERHDDGQDNEALYHKILAEIDDYNHEVDRLLGRSNMQIDQSGQYLTGGIDLNQASPVLRANVKRYACADVLAAHYKLLQQRSILWLALLATLGFACLEVYDQLLVGCRWGSAVLLGFPLALALALLSLRRSALWHDKFLGYRALAEAMRVQYFWLALGAKWRVPDHYLDKHRGELQWVRWAIMAWVMPIGRPGSLAEPGLPLPLPERIAYLREQWARDQEKYFHRRLRVNGRLCDRSARWRNAMFYAAVIVVLATRLTQQCLFTAGCSEGPWMLIEESLLLFVALAFVIGGAIAYYEEKMTYAEELLQYNLAHRRFNLASELISKAVDAGRLDVAQQLIHELGQESLWENADWVQLHQHRPPSVPQG